MDDREWLDERFEEQRNRLRAVAYRMLGSLSDAEDAVQEAWLRSTRAEAGEVEDAGAWLTTIVARVSLNMLRARRTHEQPVAFVPEPVIDPPEEVRPDHEALLADAVGIALLVVLEELSPPERLAYVLHDMFDVPFEEIAPVVDRSPAAARQLASRARRRIRGAAPPDDRALGRQRSVVAAFRSAARDGDLRRVIAALDPDVVLRADLGEEAGGVVEARGAEAVAKRAKTHSRLELEEQPVLVNGSPGVLCRLDGSPYSVLGFTVVGERITAIEILADPERIARLDLSGLGT